MISLKVLSTAAILAVALPLVTASEGFAQKGAGSGHFSGSGGGGGGGGMVGGGGMGGHGGIGGGMVGGGGMGGHGGIGGGMVGGGRHYGGMVDGGRHYGGGGHYRRHFYGGGGGIGFGYYGLYDYPYTVGGYYEDDCYVVRRRVLTRYGWRIRRVVVCG